jgi:hypothetical protein
VPSNSARYFAFVAASRVTPYSLAFVSSASPVAVASRVISETTSRSVYSFATLSSTPETASKKILPCRVSISSGALFSTSSKSLSYV